MEHLYRLTDSKERPWFTLKVISNAPASTFLPSFYEGETIKGSVTLNLLKEESIKAISVQVRGASDFLSGRISRSKSALACCRGIL